MTRFSTELERKLSEKLQESRHFIELVANGTPDMLYVLDLEKRKAVFINKRVIDMLGHDHDLFEALHPEDRADRLSHLQSCRRLKEYETREIDLRMRVKDGSWNWFRVRDMAFKRKDDGSVAQIIGIAQNMHGQQSAERTLKAVFEAVPAGIQLYKAVRDGNHRIIDFQLQMINRTGELVLGEQTETGMLLSTLQLKPGQDLIGNMIKTVRSGEPGEDVICFSARNCTHWHLVKYRKFEDGVILTHTDITDIKRAEDEIRESKHFIEQVMNMSPDFVFILDVRDLTIVYLNEHLLEVLGCGKEYLFERGATAFSEKLHPDDYDRRIAHISACASLNDKDTADIEVRIKTSGGEYRWFRLREKVFRRNEKGEVLQLISVGHDIHKSKLAEEELRQQQLQSEERMLTLKAVFDALPNGIQVYKALRNEQGAITDFEYLFVNKITQKLIGKAKLAGKKHLEEHPGVTELNHFKDMVGVVETGRPYESTHLYGRKGASKWYRVTSAKFGDGLIVSTEDVTSAHQGLPRFWKR